MNSTKPASQQFLTYNRLCEIETAFLFQPESQKQSSMNIFVGESASRLGL